MSQTQKQKFYKMFDAAKSYEKGIWLGFKYNYQNQNNYWTLE